MKRIVLLLLYAQGILHAASGSSEQKVQRIILQQATLPSGELTIETTSMAEAYHSRGFRFALEQWSDSEATEEISHALGVTAIGGVDDEVIYNTTGFVAHIKRVIIESPTLSLREVLDQATECLSFNSYGLVEIMGILIYANKCYEIYGADKSMQKRSLLKLTLSERKIESPCSIGGTAMPTICWTPKESL